MTQVIKTARGSRWAHPTEYALKDYTKEQLLSRVFWLQDHLDEQHADIMALFDQLDRAEVIIDFYTNGK